MKLKKYKLADIAKVEISGVDKKTVDGEIYCLEFKLFAVSETEGKLSFL